MYDIIVVGAGVTGSMIARNLSKYKLHVLVIEKDNDVGSETSSANSAIVHSGYDPVPGTKKAKFNVLGNRMFDKVCEELDVPFERNGSLTVATDEKQMQMLFDLEKRAKENGVEVKILNQKELREIEPCVSEEAIGALLAPTCGIVDPFRLSIHAMENAMDNGVELALEEEVVAIEDKGDYFVVKTNKNVYESKIVINSAGNYSDKIAAMVDDIDFKITPRKGEYYVLDHFKTPFVKHTIFPLPSEKGKGILVAKTTSGNYIVGPNSEPVPEKDDFSTDSGDLKDIRAQASLLVKNIPFNQTIRVFAGLRPTSTRHDFIIEKSENHPFFINVAGIESPGLVSSPAIGEYVVDELVGSLIKLIKKDDYNPCVRKYKITKELIEKNDLEFLNANPEYSQIICNCEKVSLGEIKDVLSRHPSPRSIKGIKRRCRASFGKCQGGFCQPKLVLILAKHLGVSPLDIMLNNSESNILMEEVKL